jgi:hypothetical protein
LRSVEKSPCRHSARGIDCEPGSAERWRIPS